MPRTTWVWPRNFQPSQIDFSTDGVEIELFELDPAVFEDASGQELQPDEEGPRVVPAVRLGDADDDVALLILRLEARRLEHHVRLADARAHPEEHLQAAPAGSGLIAFD